MLLFLPLSVRLGWKLEERAGEPGDSVEGPKFKVFKVLVEMG